MNPAPETEGWILVQPETVARTLEAMREVYSEIAAEADAMANLASAEIRMRCAADWVLDLSHDLQVASDDGDYGRAQGIIAIFEEVEA